MAVPFDPSLVTLIRRVLSVAETGRAEWNPGEVFVYADDNRFNPSRRQVTLSVGFTEGGGNLKRVLQRYAQKGGAHAAALAPYIATLGTSPSRADDSKFKTLLKQAGSEPAMVAAQQECFEEFYLAPAFGWAAANGFTHPLSFLVIADSFLHSGSMLQSLMAKFPEKKPKEGGNEQVWIKAYLRARHDWLKNHSSKILNGTVYRADCYLNEIARDNWKLQTTPIVMNGTKVTHVT